MQCRGFCEFWADIDCYQLPFSAGNHEFYSSSVCSSSAGSQSWASSKLELPEWIRIGKCNLKKWPLKKPARFSKSVSYE